MKNMELKRELYETKKTIDNALRNFDYVTDPALIDYYSYTLKAAGIRYQFLLKQAKQLEAMGYGNCPICVAKTQYSLTDDQTKLGAPTDFEVTVRNLKISAGAGFIVALTGEIMTMPGLPKVPAAEKIDVDENGRITGLF